MKILIAAGSSGGHIFPAIATAFRLKELNAENQIFFVGSAKILDADILKNEGYAFGTMSSDKKIFKDLFDAYAILKKFRPDVAVGFGGYVSFPMLAMARFMGITTVIHEQNLVPGLANRVLSNITDSVGISFADSRNFFISKKNIKEIGNPTRINLVKLQKDKAAKLFDLDGQVFTVLVMGGSQGAHFINDVVLDALKKMSESERRYFQFVHLSGAKDFDFVRTNYEPLGLRHKVFSFCDRMSEVYSACDLVISRAGASSISEIAFFGLPSILVPYPNPKVHQIENAKFMEGKNAAIIIEQENLSASYLKEVILNLMRDRLRLKQLSENAAKLSAPEAARRLAEEIIRNVKKR